MVEVVEAAVHLHLLEQLEETGATLPGLEVEVEVEVL